jgi:hypothetical protein
MSPILITKASSPVAFFSGGRRSSRYLHSALQARLVGEQQGEALIVGVCTNTGNIFGAGVKG